MKVDARALVVFFESKLGKVIIFAILIGLGLFAFHYFVIKEQNKGSSPEATIKVKQFRPDYKEYKESFEIAPIKKPEAPAEVKPAAPVKIEKPVEKKVETVKPAPQPVPIITPPPKPLSIDLYTSSVNQDTEISDLYAPFGRLISCELINSLDSSSLGTPVIALVTEDLWHNGKLIIPAGAELHGTAANTRMRDRIGASGTWVVVWRTKDDDNGKELRLNGIALNKTKRPESQNWDITDGSAGIKGIVIDNTDMQMLIAIAAEFLSGVGKGLVDTTTTYGTGISTQSTGGTTKDALAQGLNQAAELYAKKMLETISKDGSFVRAPGGTRFYLYVTQTIDMAESMIAGSKFAKRSLATIQPNQAQQTNKGKETVK